MSCGGVLFRSISRTQDSMSCKSASNAVALIVVAGMIAVLSLLLSRSFGSALSVGAGSSLDSLAASSAGLGGVNRIRCAFSVARYDPGLVLLLSPSVAAVVAAAASVGVVVVGELVLLLASPVTRLGLVVDGRVAATASTACLLLLCVFG